MSPKKSQLLFEVFFKICLKKLFQDIIILSKFLTTLYVYSYIKQNNLIFILKMTLHSHYDTILFICNI